MPLTIYRKCYIGLSSYFSQKSCEIATIIMLNSYVRTPHLERFHDWPKFTQLINSKIKIPSLVAWPRCPDILLSCSLFFTDILLSQLCFCGHRDYISEEKPLLKRSFKRLESWSISWASSKWQDMPPASAEVSPSPLSFIFQGRMNLGNLSPSLRLKIPFKNEFVMSCCITLSSIYRMWKWMWKLVFWCMAYLKWCFH